MIELNNRIRPDVNELIKRQYGINLKDDVRDIVLQQANSRLIPLTSGDVERNTLVRSFIRFKNGGIYKINYNLKEIQDSEEKISNVSIKREDLNYGDLVDLHVDFDKESKSIMDLKIDKFFIKSYVKKIDDIVIEASSIFNDISYDGLDLKNW
jgi:hypothetical protein